MIRTSLAAASAAILAAALSGCVVTKAATTTIGVAGKAASTTVGVAGKTAGAAIDVATPDGDRSKKRQTKSSYDEASETDESLEDDASL